MLDCKIREIEILLARVTDPGERDLRVRRLRFREARLAEGRGTGLSASVQQQYREQLLQSLKRNESEREGRGTGTREKKTAAR